MSPLFCTRRVTLVSTPNCIARAHVTHPNVRFMIGPWCPLLAQSRPAPATWAALPGADARGVRKGWEAGRGLTLRSGFRCRGCRIRRNAMTVRTARCACQACEVEVEGEPVSSGLCSCDNCKRRTGAPFGWSVYFHDEQVSRVEGPLAVLWGVQARPDRGCWRLLRRSDAAGPTIAVR